MGLFFFQAEDGIRDIGVTGVQTCALPIFERYYQAGSLIGTPAKCMQMVGRLKEMGVDEVACFVDFGVAADSVLKGLKHLNLLREMSEGPPPLTAAALRDFLAERLAGDPGQVAFEIRDQ